MPAGDADWDPRAREVLDDQIAACDRLRRRCRVAYSDYLQWSFLGHAEVMRALGDPATFSNAVSTHLSVPNGFDPPEHARLRAMVEPYFDDAEVARFAPVCRAIADTIAARLPAEGEIDLIPEVAEAFALEVQCAFMGWPAALHAPLRAWTRRNAEATLARDPAATAAVAAEFEGHVRAQLDIRRMAGAAAPDDPTTRLMRQRVDGRPLTEAEIVSIIRNWTVGELGTIAAAIGIVMNYLATRPALAAGLADAPDGLEAAIDEILRIDAPLIANRRVTTRPVEVGGRQLPAGARVTLIWASANRDEAVFGDPDRYDPAANRARNLLYGAGIHACPGAALARLELGAMIAALLRRLKAFAPVPGRPPRRAVYPAGGLRSLPLRVRCDG